MRKVLVISGILILLSLGVCECVSNYYADLPDYVEQSTEYMDLYDPQYIQPKYFIKPEE